MSAFTRNLFFFFTALVVFCAVADDRTAVTYTTGDNATIGATFFPAANSKRAVLFAHGAVFDKESWYEMAQACQQAGVAALSIDFRGYGASTAGRDPRAYYLDIQGGARYLAKAGYDEIVLVGGSMGAMAIIRACEEPMPNAIKKAFLLAPGNGSAIASTTVEKLFVVSEGDRVHAATEKSFDVSAEPKRLEVLPGDAHAQHIFKTDQASALKKLILDFVSE